MIAYELVVGARLKAGGAEVRLPSDGDLTARVRGSLYHLECKRPTSSGGALRAVKKGRKQLASRAGRTAGESPIGAIVLAANRLDHGVSQVLPADSSARLLKELDLRCREIHARHSRLFRRNTEPACHAVILSLFGLAHVTGNNGWLRAAFDAVVPVLDPEDDTLRKLSPLYGVLHGQAGESRF